MKVRLFSLGATDVLLHSATLLMAGYMALSGRAAAFAVGLASILLHEGAHALVSARFGASPARIEITPLGAVMQLEDESRLPPLKRCIMLAAGPAMTLLICAIAFQAARHGWSHHTCSLWFRVNAGLLAINLLPCLPLDGGRLLAVGLSGILPLSTVQRVMRLIGSICGASCVLLGFLVTWKTGGLQITLVACGCVMLYAAHRSTESAALAELRQWMSRKTRLEQRGWLPVKTIAVLDTLPLRRVAARLPQQARTELIVLASGIMRPLARCGEEQFFQYYMSSPWATCRGLAEACADETIDPAASRRIRRDPVRGGG